MKSDVLGQIDPYKVVLIVGSNSDISPELISHFRQEGHLLIGDGTTKLASLDYSVLSGKIHRGTRLIINAHGGVFNNVHCIDEHNKMTSSFLSHLASFNENVPLNIQLFSCFSGAAAKEVVNLPNNSVLVMHSTSDAPSSSYLNSKAIMESSLNLSSINLVEDFIHRFPLYTKQTAVVSIHQRPGIVFKHTTRAPEHEFLSRPEEIRKYLENCRSEFIKVYNEAFKSSTNIRTEMLITSGEAIEWRNDNFAYCIYTHNKQLTHTLKNKIHIFSDFINHKIFGKTALLIAAQNGHEDLVEAILASDEVNVETINEPDPDGYTPLMAAAQFGCANVVKVMLASDKVGTEVINAQEPDDDNTAFMIAVYGGHKDVIEIMLASDKVGIEVINVQDQDGYTAFMIAAQNGRSDIVQIMLASDKVGIEVINAQDSDGYSAFMIAAHKGHKDVIETMLASDKVGIEVINAQDPDGNTAFMIADHEEHSDIVELMLRSGKIDEGHSTNSLSEESENADVVDLLPTASKTHFQDEQSGEIIEANTNQLKRKSDDNELVTADNNESSNDRRVRGKIESCIYFSDMFKNVSKERHQYVKNLTIRSHQVSGSNIHHRSH